MPKTASHSVGLLALLAAVMLAALWLAPELDAASVEDAVRAIGPMAIVLLVALGIVVSPIPSGVIALVAGALYGTPIGGSLTVLGAGLGASCAFALSRHLGRGLLVSSRSAAVRTLTRERSQRGLMLTVFVTRLVPFISFDAVSYVAGLTPLRFWRFLVATLAGTTPVCFAFAAAGNTAKEGEFHPGVLAVMCGVTLLVPACAFVFRALRPRGIPSAAGRAAPPPQKGCIPLDRVRSVGVTLVM